LFEFQNIEYISCFLLIVGLYLLVPSQKLLQKKIKIYLLAKSNILNPCFVRAFFNCCFNFLFFCCNEKILNFNDSFLRIMRIINSEFVYWIVLKKQFFLLKYYAHLASLASHQQLQILIIITHIINISLISTLLIVCHLVFIKNDIW